MMKHGKRIAWLTVLLSLVIVIATALPATLAYVIDQTQPLVNTFIPDPAAISEVTVQIKADKTVINNGLDTIGPEGFQFVLENVVTGEVLTAVSDMQGQATFTLGFCGLDAGEVYHYTLREINDHRTGVTYSELVYAIQVSVDRVDDKLMATVKLNGTATGNCVAAFENIYSSGTADLPPTGDDVPVLLYAMLVLCSGGLLLMLRRRIAR